MKRDALKWSLIGGALVFLLLYGIEVATTGIENVHGPLDNTQRVREETPLSPSAQAAAAAQEVAERLAAQREEAAREQWLQAAAAAVQGAAADPLRPEGGAPQREPSVNQVADRTAGVLQSLSSGGIRFIVGLFDTVTE
ncbi:hypothetical protein IDH44_04680 [Paenibacillus sp. IB182496]|uniref:Uncharacterized protein n=1 Tax=Paenibacillus sabuli TaxID=2772509 RepID=A0A927BRB7_9BACL|nr:hypothetical protein [Paenibacillus sabuli]MBD2844476.1 hypothetical protein [Paenibacillus sabuli]